MTRHQQYSSGTSKTFCPGAIALQGRNKLPQLVPDPVKVEAKSDRIKELETQLKNLDGFRGKTRILIELASAFGDPNARCDMTLSQPTRNFLESLEELEVDMRARFMVWLLTLNHEYSTGSD